MLNRIDKQIIRVLLKNLDLYLTTREIAKKSEIAPLTAKRHLNKLGEEGYVKCKIDGAFRDYVRRVRIKEMPIRETPNGQPIMAFVMTHEPDEKVGKKVKAPSKILWTLLYDKGSNSKKGSDGKNKDKK